MKKKTLCAFALILWFLLFSTFFSLWVEQAMVPWVTVTQSRPSNNSVKDVLPLDCLAGNGDGSFALLQTFEGTGWEEGTRAAPFDPRNYSVGPDKIELEYGGGTFIRYYSKLPEPGQLVNVVESPQESADTLLVLCQDGLPTLKEDVPEGYGVMERTDTALLIFAEETTFPFLPKEADSELFETDPFGGTERRIYSLTEFRDFTGALQLLALVPGLALAVVILWTYSCLLTKDVKRNKQALTANGIFAAMCLCAIPIVLNAAKLPSSLLPQGNICDFSHYAAEFGGILSALERFAAAGNQAAAAALQSAGSALTGSLAVLLGGILLAAAFVAAEAVLLKRRVHNGQHFRQAEKSAEKRDN